MVLRVEPPLDYDNNRSKYELSKYDKYHPSEEFNLYYAKEITRLIEEHELRIKN